MAVSKTAIAGLVLAIVALLGVVLIMTGVMPFIGLVPNFTMGVKTTNLSAKNIKTDTMETLNAGVSGFLGAKDALVYGTLTAQDAKVLDSLVTRRLNTDTAVSYGNFYANGTFAGLRQDVKDKVPDNYTKVLYQGDKIPKINVV